jgi:diacylglycerol kinase family enzyme
VKNDRERLCLIVNPHSAGGATRGRLDDLRRAAAASFAEWEVRETNGPRHATAIARQAATEGFGVIAAVGGDGTASETVNGLFEGDRPLNPNVVFSVVPAGTGSDLVRTLAVPRDLDEAFRVLAHGDTRTSDAIHVTSTLESGESTSQVGINQAGFGVSAEVVRRSNRSSKQWGGTATFLKATLGAVANYRPAPVRVKWAARGEERSWEGPVLLGFTANGRYAGGGMHIGRGASMQDGLLKLILVPEMSLQRILVALPRLYSGHLEAVRGVVVAEAETIEASLIDRGDVPVDVDGEQPGSLPVAVRVLKGTLKIRGQWA